jgi:ribosomal protein L18
VFFSNRYAYASILHKATPSDGGHYVASASTLQGEVRVLGVRACGICRCQCAYFRCCGGRPAPHTPDNNNTQVRQLLDGTSASYCDVKASKLVGRLLAEKAKQANVAEIHFDNHANLRYQGKVGWVLRAVLC